LPRCVLEKNPPKQGLKQNAKKKACLSAGRFREKSTKTRIETNNISSWYMELHKF